MEAEEAVEIRGFLGLTALFKERGWPIPYRLKITEKISGLELLSRLKVDPKEVEVVFINGKAYSLDTALISPGDRVALVPPGTPGPYRVYLGFVELEPKKTGIQEDL